MNVLYIVYLPSGSCRAERRESDMNVRKRSGRIVPFDAEFIRRAITLAAAAAG